MTTSTAWGRWARALFGMVVLAAALAAQAQDKRNLAPGFTGLPADAQVVITPLDVELFSISAGGVMEPKADWTASAQRHMKEALHQRTLSLGRRGLELSTDQADSLAELLSLHAAVARSIAIHHAGFLKLPTKEDRLDWSFGDALQPLQQATAARYALFTWVRDSYASPERVAMMIGLAMLGVGVSGGFQVGYASLVDLQTGQVLWFNQLQRGFGDLRDAAKATESVGALLAGFPARQP
ncbi:MAG: hypothetical protein QE285_16200 [Aquabacterium sp.]|nr:hypothetical protein [Aquabacterium sp.]